MIAWDSASCDRVGQQGQNLRVHSAELVLVDGNSDQNIGGALGRRARVVQSGGVAIKIARVYQLAVPGDQDAANFLELSGANGGIERAEAGVGKAAVGKGSRGPVSCRGLGCRCGRCWVWEFVAIEGNNITTIDTAQRAGIISRPHAFDD